MLFVLFSAFLVGVNGGHLFATKGGALPTDSGVSLSMPEIPSPVPEPNDAQLPLESYGPPKPYSFEYSADGYDGKSSRQEFSDGKQVTGQYTLQGPDGINRIVNYIADDNGFRASVLTNEPGTESKNPSAIHFKSSQLPAEEIALKYGPQEPVKQKFIAQTYETQPTKTFSNVETELVKPALTNSYRTDTIHISKQPNADFLKPALTPAVFIAKPEAVEFFKPALTNSYRTDTVHISKIETPEYFKPTLSNSYRTDTVHISKQPNADFLKPALATGYRADTVHIVKPENTVYLKPALTNSYRTDTVHVTKFIPVPSVQKVFSEKAFLPKYETKTPLMPLPTIKNTYLPQIPTLIKSKTSPALIYRQKLVTPSPMLPMYEEQQKQEPIDEPQKMIIQKKEEEPMDDQKRDFF